MKPTSWPKNAASYELLGIVGRGATSVVHRAINKERGEECAVKVFNLRNLPDDSEERILKEISTLSLLDHPNVIKLHASFVSGDAELWMAMPLFAHGSVLDVLRDKFPTGLAEDALGAVLFPVLSALSYLHSQSALHRDVKAGNIFVATNGQVVLGDFGVAADLVEGGEAATGRRTFAGTPCWMAPEVMMQQTSYSVAADIWSFGITCIELAKGRAPHSDLNAMKVVMKIMSSPPPSLDENEDKKKFSTKFRSMTRRCLSKQPEERPTAAVLLKDPFFKKVKDADYLKALLAGLPPVWQRGKKQEAEAPPVSVVDVAAASGGAAAPAAGAPAEHPDLTKVRRPSAFGLLMKQVDSDTKISK